MATHSSTLAWKIPWADEPGGLRSMGAQRVGHDWATSLHFTCKVWDIFLEVSQTRLTHRLVVESEEERKQWRLQPVEWMVVILTVLIRVTCVWRRNSEPCVCVCVCVCVFSLKNLNGDTMQEIWYLNLELGIGLNCWYKLVNHKHAGDTYSQKGLTLGKRVDPPNN